MQDVDLKRREFIALLGGAAALPLAARAQHAERVRRIGVISGANVQLVQAGHAVFLQELQRLGWTEGRNSACLSAMPPRLGDTWQNWSRLRPT